MLPFRLATNEFMKRAALQIMRGCGMFALARAVSADMARILMYHNFSESDRPGTDEVSVNSVRKQFEYLRRHFRVVPLSHLCERLESGRPLGRRSVALTIDDGRRNCYEFLFPLLKEFAMPATFFVVSSFIRREDWIWTDKVLWLSEQPSRSSELSEEGIGGFFDLLNRMPPQRRNARIHSIAAGMGISIPKDVPPKYAPCTWNELREMADSGLMEIGSHTATHPILATLTDEESWWELTVSRAQIEEGLGRNVSSFCFPNGKPGDYRATQVRQIRDAGYRCAVVASFGIAGNRANPFELPRIGVGGKSDALVFAKRLDGAEYYQAKLRGSLRWLRAARRKAVV
jgi:peptidoglycan/xylan/chitin deacetylase (PgdA/CDA1 family)